MIKKAAKGFTLIELMIVVAIIGILAAIAIPNFLRYQLRSKFGELRTNVEAVRKSQETLRQGERQMCFNAATGAYYDTPAVPTAPCVAAAGTGSNKCTWLPADLGMAQSIDWNVEGATYGVYQTVTITPPPVVAPYVTVCNGRNLGLGMAIGAFANIDADPVLGAVCLWKDSRDAQGNIVGPAPACPALAAAGADATLCPTANAPPGTAGFGQVVLCSADNVF